MDGRIIVWWSRPLLCVSRITFIMHATFGDILVWARVAYAANYSFNPPGGWSQSKSVALLFDAMPNVRQLLLTGVPIMCGGVLTSTVVVFDFVSQLLSLLHNVNATVHYNRMQIPQRYLVKPYPAVFMQRHMLATSRNQAVNYLFPLFNRLIARMLQATNGFHWNRTCWCVHADHINRMLSTQYQPTRPGDITAFYPKLNCHLPKSNSTPRRSHSQLPQATSAGAVYICIH